MGRFTTQDPWAGEQEQPQTLHPYAYVHNNAVNFTDPTGKWRWGTSADGHQYKIPEDPEMDAINLDESWLAKDKKRDCLSCVGCYCRREPMERTGITLPPNYEEFENATANDYMKYWLAWEELNPCYYRLGANCMGAALEVSYLYRGWSSAPFDDAGYTSKQYEDDGFMHPENWKNWKKGYFKRDLRHREDAGDIITYTPTPQGMLVLPPGHTTKYPSHMIVIVNDGNMCFEKQSPTGFYQLRPCDRGGYPWVAFNVDYFRPTND